MTEKTYSIHDKLTDIDKLNNVDVKSVDGVIESVKINGEEAGGGGGSSDFSTAELTFVLASGKTAQFTCPTYQIEGDRGMALGNNGARIGNVNFSVILCKGNAMLELTQYTSDSNISTSGDIEDIGNDTYIITGDCTITIS